MTEPSHHNTKTKQRARRTCPRCGSYRRIPWLWGEPAPFLDAWEKAGKVLLGGCCIEEGAPEWHCVECEHDWARVPPSEYSMYHHRLDEVQFRKMAMLRVVAELIRRHGKRQQLLALEIHPAMGQQYAIAVYRRRGKDRPEEVVTLGNEEAFTISDRVEERFPYIPRIRETWRPCDVVDELESFLGLKHASKKKPWDAPSFMFHVMSSMFEDYSDHFDFTCGWHDSSDYGGSHVHEEIRGIKCFSPADGWGRHTWTSDMFQASKYWMITYPVHQIRRVLAILDLTGNVWAPIGAILQFNAFEMFQSSSRKLRPVLEELHRVLIRSEKCFEAQPRLFD